MKKNSDVDKDSILNENLKCRVNEIIEAIKDRQETLQEFMIIYSMRWLRR